MLTRLNMLCVGLSGVRPQVVETLVQLLNRYVIPYVPEAGSVGASDLAPLAHVALVLVGEGRAWYNDELLPGAEALKRAKIPACDLQGRDGFALINGLSQSTGIGSLALNDTARLVANAEVAAALSMSALGSRLDSLDERVLRGKPHAGSLISARRLRRLFEVKKKE
ncbi:MAG: aromatic amino acid lyase [Myxococcales bacterium]|nr:MAG: aromatic amino acid lyase [Myxococcales bacterium]